MEHIALNLKAAMLEIDGTPIKKIDKVKEQFKKNGQPKSVEELKAEAEDFTIGDGLARHLMFSITPKDPEDAAKLNRYARKISNITYTGKAEWKATETEIKDVLEMLQRVPMKEGVQHLVGDLINYLEENLLKLKQG